MFDEAFDEFYNNDLEMVGALIGKISDVLCPPTFANKVARLFKTYF
jgi:hypothetical protein